LAIYYRNAHAISLKVFFPTKPIVLADWFSFMQKPNVIVRVPEKKESGRKANRNPANGIQKIMPAAFMMIRMASSMAWRAPTFSLAAMSSWQGDETRSNVIFS
jgi:hypothetical protein